MTLIPNVLCLERASDDDTLTFPFSTSNFHSKFACTMTSCATADLEHNHPIPFGEFGLRYLLFHGKLYNGVIGQSKVCQVCLGWDMGNMRGHTEVPRAEAVDICQEILARKCSFDIPSFNQN